MNTGSERVLILAPFGRDGVLLERALNRGQIETRVCSDFEALCEEIAPGAGALLIADEALSFKRAIQLSEVLAAQPGWSDLSLLIMTSGGEATFASERRLNLLKPIHGPTILLERPLRIATLLSMVRSTLRARRRQYQVRDLLEKEQRSASTLRAANDALRRSNDSLAEFAHIVSHDLKEPLRTVAAYTQLLGLRYKDRLDHDADEYIRFTIDGVSRMNRLIDDLLSYSQITKQPDSLDTRADCGEVLQIAKDNLGALIRETGTTIVASELPSVAVESQQLVQLFQNLLSNAIKYRKFGVAPFIRIDASSQGQWWLFQISDNGIGFDQQYSEQIFGLFKRLERNDETGTGIGLAICKRIVEHYGGRIWANSSIGAGASFSLLLPGIRNELHNRAS
jgi:signal transduction histidine kinase